MGHTAFVVIVLLVFVTTVVIIIIMICFPCFLSPHHDRGRLDLRAINRLDLDRIVHEVDIDALQVSQS